MWKSLITNWTTSIPGALIALCAGTMLTDLLPDQYDKYGMAFCMLIAAFGFGAAKSAGVTNSQHPAEAISVSKAVAAAPNAAAPAQEIPSKP